MVDWCKTCGRTLLEHKGETMHTFVSSLDGIFPKAETKEEDMSASENRADMAEVRFTEEQELTYKTFVLMNKGLSKRAIADNLGVSESTIRTILADAIPEVSLEREIAQILNKHSAENGSNTPDFILAEYLMACLKAFNKANNSCRDHQGQGFLNG